MALQSVARPFLWPGLCYSLATTFSTGNGASMTAAGHYDCMIFSAQQDMTISHVGWRVNTATGSPTADVRIETVAATGQPSGTLWATNTNIVTAAVTAAWRLDALTASASITKGQTFAVKIAYNSGTTLVARTLTGGVNRNIPVRWTNTGTPARNSVPLVIALGSSSTTFYPVGYGWPVTTLNSNTFNNTNSAARGNRFQVPFKCRVVGLSMAMGATAGNHNTVLYDDSGTELSSSSTAFDGDVSNLSALAPKEMFFDNTVTLSPATWYRMAVEPSSATNVNQYVINLPSADYRSAMPGGTNFHYATRASGTWTDTTTSVAIMDLLIDQLDDGASGSAAVGSGLLRGLVG